jgi:hypothetical protein
VLGSSAADTAEEEAVVQAWMGYWKAASNTFYYARKADDLDRYSRDDARRAVLRYLEQLKDRQNRVVGWARDNVTSVRVDGNTATVRDCTKNFTFDVDEEGTAITRPVPYFDITGVLVKRDGRWVVTKSTIRNLKTSCLG